MDCVRLWFHTRLVKTVCQPLRKPHGEAVAREREGWCTSEGAKKLKTGEIQRVGGLELLLTSGQRSMEDLVLYCTSNNIHPHNKSFYLSNQKLTTHNAQ